jgi:choline dehydrogenase-like flavoprotein
MHSQDLMGTLPTFSLTLRRTTTFHPGWACRMGPAAAKWAVVDDQLRLYGLQTCA